MFGAVHNTPETVANEALATATHWFNPEAYTREKRIWVAQQRRLASDGQVRSISHWSPYDRVGVVNADP
jgi:hypothetical protein